MADGRGARHASSSAACARSAICGALPEEQVRAQPVEVDLDVVADLGARRADPTRWTTPSTTAAIAADVERVHHRRAIRAARATGAAARRGRARGRARPVRHGRGAQAATAGAAAARHDGCAHHSSVARRPPRARVPGPRARTWATAGSTFATRWRASRAAGLVAVSPVYETDPVGGPSGQDRYLNLVVELDTDCPPASCWPSGTASSRPPNGCGPSGGAPGRSTSTSSGSTASRSTSPTSRSRTPDVGASVRDCARLPTSPPTWFRPSARSAARAGWI